MSTKSIAVFWSYVLIGLLLGLGACGDGGSNSSKDDASSDDGTMAPGISLTGDHSYRPFALNLDNKGTEFILAFLPNISSPANVELHLSSDVATDVTVEYPVNSPTFTTTVGLVPGSVTIVALPATAASAWTSDVPTNNAVRAVADEEFVAYMINRYAFTSDAALGLPVDTMNTDYIVMDYANSYNSQGGVFNVYAAFDSTTVTITPSQAVTGHAAGSTFSVTLNRGEGLQYRSIATVGAAANLTGTIVTADRPVGLTNGNVCTTIGPEGACDHIFEVAQPVQTWGNEVLVANLPLRAGSIYRIMASVDGTKVLQDGGLIGTINRGQFIETAMLADNHVFSSGGEPIYVVQYMTGLPEGGTGDPSMGNMIPAAQYLSDYTFSTVGGAQFARNFLTIIAENSDVAGGTIVLDGTPVPAADFTAIGASGYSAAVVMLLDGVHTTSSAGVHGITVEGYNSYDSYLYPGGALFQFINPVGDANPPIVTLTDMGGGVLDGLAEDNRPSEDVNGNGVLDPGEDLNGDGLIDEDTGIFFVALEPGAVNLTLTVDPFVPGDPTATFTVTQVDPDLDAMGQVTVTDGAGNTTTTDIFLGGIPPLIEMTIDIKPWHFPNYIKPWSKGLIPVAILGSDDLDVNDVDVATLRFGPGNAMPAHPWGGFYFDVNRDGVTDLLTFYRRSAAGLEPGDTEACLTGYTLDMIELVGCDSVVVLEHNKHHHGHHKHHWWSKWDDDDHDDHDKKHDKKKHHH